MTPPHYRHHHHHRYPPPPAITASLTIIVMSFHGSFFGRGQSPLFVSQSLATFRSGHSCVVILFSLYIIQIPFSICLCLLVLLLLLFGFPKSLNLFYAQLSNIFTGRGCKKKEKMEASYQCRECYTIAFILFCVCVCQYFAHLQNPKGLTGHPAAPTQHTRPYKLFTGAKTSQTPSSCH